MTRPIPVACALAASLFATGAFASAENEYTLSESETNAAVTTYQAQPALQPYQPQPVQQTYQPLPAETGTAQFGEIVYDTQPYYPDGTAVGTQGGTQAFTTADPYAVQPTYVDTSQAFQPQAQPTYSDTTQVYQPLAQPTYQPFATGDAGGASWK